MGWASTLSADRMRPSRKRNRTTKRQECSTPEGVCEQATRSFTGEIIGSRKLIWRPRSTNGLGGNQWRSLEADFWPVSSPKRSSEWRLVHLDFRPGRFIETEDVLK